MEWQLEYDSDQLKLLGISIDDVQRAISLNYEKEFLGIGLMEQSNGGREWIRLTLKPDERGETTNSLTLVTMRPSSSIRQAAKSLQRLSSKL